MEANFALQVFIEFDFEFSESWFRIQRAKCRPARGWRLTGTFPSQIWWHKGYTVRLSENCSYGTCKESCYLGDEQTVASNALTYSGRRDPNLTHTFSEDRKKEHFQTQCLATRPLIEKPEEKSTRRPTYRSISLTNTHAKIDMVIVSLICNT